MQISNLINFIYRHAGIIATATFIFFISYVIYLAWVVEDAYITFRVVDNFVNGYGLTWNSDERVQAYTSPLWMLLHIPFHFFYQGIHNVTIAISVIITIATCYIIFLAFRKNYLLLAAIFIALSGSRGFVEYSTSGLENPLTHFWLALFYYNLFIRRTGWYNLILIASLALVTRMDTIIFYLPAIILTAPDFRKINFKKIILCLSPFLAWSLFSLFYYGFIFPNTKYAKLGSDADLWLIILSGLRYIFYDFFVNHLPGFILTFITFFISLSYFWYRENNPQKNYFISMSAGTFFYIIYLIWIGGDFMSGRMFTGIILVSIILSAMFVDSQKNTRKWTGCFFIFIILLSIAGEFFAERLPATTRTINRNTKPYEVGQEWPVYAKATGLFNKDNLKPWDFEFYQHGLYERDVARNMPPGEKKTRIVMASGMCGYAAGPNVVIIDLYGLGDPLLARLPVMSKTDWWRVGHFNRKVPEGYLEFRRTGDIKLMDMNLRLYYEPLKFIISGPLWSMERIITIVEFNLGLYDPYRDIYLKKME